MQFAVVSSAFYSFRFRLFSIGFYFLPSHLDICSCLDYIEIFPYLREAVVENTTQPEYIFCNYSTTASTAASFHVAKSTNITTNVTTTTSPSPLSNATATSSPPSGSISNIGHLPNVTTLGNISTTTLMNSHDLSPHQFIYSSGKVFAVRLRFNNKPLPPSPTPLSATSLPGDMEANPLQGKIDNWNLNVTVEYRFLKKGK